jgi:hypothetical protein
LPQIKSELQLNIEKVEEQLSRMPREPSSNPQQDVTILLHQFSTDLFRHVEGIPDGSGVLQRLRPLQNAFRKEIRRTAPNFQPCEEPEEIQASSNTQYYFILEEDEKEYDAADVLSHSRAIFLDEIMKKMEE